MKKLINNKWMEHPWARTGMVEEVCVDFLYQISNKDNQPYTDDLDGQIKPQSIIFKNIEKEGMRDPLLIVISRKHKTIRLESGNHRIHEARKKGYTHLPTATFIIDDILMNEGNGVHFFDATKLINFDKIINNPYPQQEKLSDLLYFKKTI